jgi:tRNA(fMet)-specific endonuclease VapC
VSYYLDTNTCIDFINGTYDSVAKHMRLLEPADIRIPAVVKAELLTGALKSARIEQNLQLVERFLQPLQVVAFDDACTLVYADIRSKLEAQGQKIGPNDLLIAATVAANNGTLVTNNLREFSRIDNLQLETWVILDA